MQEHMDEQKEAKATSRSFWGNDLAQSTEHDDFETNEWYEDVLPGDAVEEADVVAAHDDLADDRRATSLREEAYGPADLYADEMANDSAEFYTDEIASEPAATVEYESAQTTADLSGARDAQVQSHGSRQIVRRRQGTRAIQRYDANRLHPFGRRPKGRPAPTKGSAEVDKRAKAASGGQRKASAPVANDTANASDTARLDNTPSVTDAGAKLEQAKEVVVESASVVANAAGNAISHLPDAARGAYDKAKDLMPEENPLKGLRLKERIASLPHTRNFIIAYVCLLLLLIYGVGALFYAFHLPAHVWVNGHDVSGLSKSAFAEQAKGYAQDYVLKIDGDGVDLDLRAADIDLTYDETAFVDATLSKVSGWGWPIDAIVNQNWEIRDGIAYDQAKLDQAVSNAVTWANKSATFPKSASITYDAKSKQFSGVKQEYGTAVSEDAAKQKASDAAATLRHEVTLGEEDILQPEVTLDDSKFDEILQQANTRANLKLDLQIDGKRIAIIDQSLLAEWVTVDDTGKITGDIETITKWTRGEFSSKIDTVGTKRVYTRPDGKEVTVEGGSYGWSVDGQALAGIIVEHIEQSSTDPIEVPLQSRGKVLAKGTPDWGKRYIDVDLAEQYVRMYDENGESIWEEYCVSGDTTADQGTITGVYAIEYKQSPMTLIGLDYDGDGMPDYENDVTYWMPFSGGYGLHDAPWRYTFGGNTFQYSGSHGCINLPYDSAAVLYGLVEKGDPVVVHW